MKRLVISNDCDFATIENMRQAQDKFEEYGIPFSESCWIFAKNEVSLLEYGEEVTYKKPDYDFLKPLIEEGKIDTLHTWGNFPDGDFNARIARLGYELLQNTSIRFKAWTAHGGLKDYQNLSPLGQGDVKNSPYYHMDYTQQLGLRFFCRNVDIDVLRPAKNVIVNQRYFRRFRGPTKEQAYSITLKWFHKQIEMAERRNLWHHSPDDVIIYTHFYAKDDVDSPHRSVPVHEFEIPDSADRCLRQLAERRDKGELKILRLNDLLCNDRPNSYGVSSEQRLTKVNSKVKPHLDT